MRYGWNNVEEVFMKKIAVTYAALCLRACVLVLSCSNKGAKSGGGGAGVWTWGAFNDAAKEGSSQITVIEDLETINGESMMTYDISGEITGKYIYGYAGWYAYPDDPTMEALREAKSFSFKVLGDGQTYYAMVTTSDIEDGCYYRVAFDTKKDQAVTVTVKMDSLWQPETWGVKKKFNQNNAVQIQWQTANNGKPGDFKLKIWDLNLY
jgi:hypothetical protein